MPGSGSPPQAQHPAEWRDRELDGVRACESPTGEGGASGASWANGSPAPRQGLESLSEQSDREMDRLDQAFDVRPYFRLACQSEIGAEDVLVEITEESLSAFMDESAHLRRELEAAGRWPLKKAR